MKPYLLKSVPVASISTGERFRKDYQDIEKLMDDIQKHSLIHPIAVLERGPDDWLLLAGGRRFTACKNLGFETIAAHVFEGPMDELEIREIELCENISRADLTFVERAKLTEQIHSLQIAKYGQAIGSGGGKASTRNTAELIGRSHTTVEQDLELARALQSMPSIAAAKNKSEALKLWNKEKEKILREELATRLENKKASTPVELRQRQLSDNYVIGDFFEHSALFPAETFHVCEVDPPYGIALEDSKKLETPELTMAAYNEVDEALYPAFIDRLVAECKRVLNPNGWLLLWHAPDPWGEMIFQTLLKHGFYVQRNCGVWVKETNKVQTRWPEYNLGYGHERFFYARKGMAVIQKQGRSNVFSYKPVPSEWKTHPTERPIEMIQEVLSTFTPAGGRVLVPFAGSGNTLLAAANLGLNAVGYDLAKDYKDSYIVKVHKTVPGAYASYL